MFIKHSIVSKCASIKQKPILPGLMKSNKVMYICICEVHTG